MNQGRTVHILNLSFQVILLKENYKKYLALTDKSLNSQLRYAKFLFYGKQFQESIDIIKQIVAKDSSDYINYRLLGYSSYEIKDYKTGLTAMNKFFSMNKFIRKCVRKLS